MPRVQHPKVVHDQIIRRLTLPDPTSKEILIVKVDMPLSADDPDFDADEFRSLTEAVTAAMGNLIDSADIIRVERR